MQYLQAHHGRHFAQDEGWETLRHVFVVEDLRDGLHVLRERRALIAVAETAALSLLKERVARHERKSGRATAGPDRTEGVVGSKRYPHRGSRF